MNFLVKSIVGFLAAVISAMGMGGGGILLIYLSAFTNTPQLKAQGINLIYFIPIAIVSLIFHIKNGFLKKKAALFMIISAVPAAVLGAFLSGNIDQDLLRKGLALFLLFLGLKEIITSFKKKEKRT